MAHALTPGNTIGGVKLVTIEAAMRHLYGRIDPLDMTEFNLDMHSRGLIEKIGELQNDRGYPIDTRRTAISFKQNGKIVEMECSIAFGAAEWYEPFTIQIPSDKLCKR